MAKPATPPPSAPPLGMGRPGMGGTGATPPITMDDDEEDEDFGEPMSFERDDF
ncbi:MAG: hypothetical protein ACM3OB_03215 [Acidobacteriota bacterium]